MFSRWNLGLGLNVCLKYQERKKKPTFMEKNLMLADGSKTKLARKRRHQLIWLLLLVIFFFLALIFLRFKS